MTEGRIFVAHNSSFDYGFLRKEFSDLGYEFKRETLCTVKLSRKAYPDLPSYSLGKICSYFGIEIKNRHRALGDAEATTILFQKMIKEQPFLLEGINYQRFLQEKFSISKLPNKPGIYFLLNKQKEVIYIGKSIRLKERIKEHLTNFFTKKGIKIIDEIDEVKYELTGNELMALIRETIEIKKHQPPYNKREKRENYPYGIYAEYINDIGSLQIKKTDEDENLPLFTFETKHAALNKLVELTENYTLCERMNTLQKVGSGLCFSYQLKKCNGICAGKENVEEYNTRFQTLLNSFQIKEGNYFLIGEGRTRQERSLVLIENCMFKGYAYVNEKNISEYSPSSLLLFIEKQKTNHDLQRIIRLGIGNNLFIKRLIIK